LKEEVLACRRCPRLVAFRETVKPRAQYSDQDYWRKPVPGFGDINGRLLVLGIAPALHGGNRTGRVFTGDSSGRFLVKALHRGGFANQPISESVDDGLVYSDCYVTAAVKCAPPGDRPSAQEFANCSGYLGAEIGLMKNLQAVLTLGALSFRAYLEHLRAKRVETRGLHFEHGRAYRIHRNPTVYASYHPSPRNTNTGKLTEEMLFRLVMRIRSDLQHSELSPKDN